MFYHKPPSLSNGFNYFTTSWLDSTGRHRVVESTIARLVASSLVFDCCWIDVAASTSILFRFWRFCCSMARSRSSGVDRLLLSSGGGGMAIQLYCRFSTGSPQRSYSNDCERSDSKQSKQTTTNLPFSIEMLLRGCRCCFRNGKSCAPIK